MTIPVTKPFVPPFEEYSKFLEGVWEREWFTNHGPLVTKLEKELELTLGVPQVFFVTNGTIALQLAIKALGLKGKVITTPFSYVATTSTIAWEGCEPIMADIDVETLNISPGSIEPLIDDETTGIIATHVYGNPCDVDAIEKIASKHNLKVIYDGAHAFGTKFKGKSIFEFGDLSTTSFHATKLFHTVEGGAVLGRQSDALAKIGELRNFGHTSPTSFGPPGINGKNSEFHAAMGLCNLKYIHEILQKRKDVSELYDRLFTGAKLRRPEVSVGADYNHAYYPIILDHEEVCIELISRLGAYGIYPRRYFFPSLTELEYINGKNSSISRDISGRVLCLPLFHSLSFDEVELVGKIVLETVGFRNNAD